MKLDEGGGEGEEDVGDETAELADGLIGDGRGRGGEAAGEGVAARIRGEVEV